MYLTISDCICLLFVQVYIATICFVHRHVDMYIYILYGSVLGMVPPTHFVWARVVVLVVEVLLVIIIVLLIVLYSSNNNSSRSTSRSRTSNSTSTTGTT